MATRPRLLSKSELNKATNAQLKEALNQLQDYEKAQEEQAQASASNQSPGGQPVSSRGSNTAILARLDQIIQRLDAGQAETTRLANEVKGLREDNKKMSLELETMKTEREQMRRDLKFMSTALHQHQMYLEQVEANKRAANIMVLGVPENPVSKIN
jgi:chromosome segregation ATPase